MSFGTFRWALASIFTSLALAVVAPLAAQANRERPAQAAPASELDLARRAAIYLRIDLEARVLEVKARGMVLERFPVNGLELRLFERDDRVDPPALPAIWVVEVAPEAEHRRRLAPEELRPYQADDPEGGDAPAPVPAAAEPETAEPPASYRVDLEGNWELAVGQKLPGGLATTRAALAVSSAWARLRGRNFAAPHLLAITLDPAAARKLHHLFQPGLALLAE